MNEDIIHVLLVEDNPGDAHLVKEILGHDERSAFRVKHVSTLEEAMSSLALGAANQVILLDLGLPDESGLHTLQRIIPVAREASIVVITGVQDEELGIAAIREGAHDYLIKGQVDGGQLRRILRYDVERHKMQSYLRTEHELLRAVIDNVPDYIYVKDAESRFLLANRALADLVGARTPEDLLGKMDFDFFPQQLAAAFFSDEQAMIRSGKPLVNQEEASMDASGNPKWTSTSKVPLRDEHGQVTRIIGIGRDITSRKYAEGQLLLQATALKSTANGVVITDTAGKILWLNPSFTALTGFSAEEATGQAYNILNSGEHPKSFFDQMWKSILAGQVWRGEIANRRKDGTLFTVEQTITPVRNQRGDVARFVAIMQDVTERKKLEQQLNHAQKMESVGRLAGGVAHDFNNLLTVISGYSDLLLPSLSEIDPAAQQVKEIAQAAGRAAALTRQLLAFSRKQVLELTNVDINSVIREAESMLRRLIGEDVEVRIACAGEEMRALVDTGQLVQVLMNLAVNARDAMPKGGVLTIETAAADFGPEYAHTHPAGAVGRYVQLTIRDTGVGMDRTTLAHIFEPFFTTKGPGAGTGLGLSTVYGIVKQSSGHILVESEPGCGTTFRICFPRVFARPEPAAARKATAPALGNETVLLVEDEPSLRNLAREILRRAGYQVIVAANGPEALLACEKSRGEIALVITDLVMPGMSGQDLTQRLALMHPEMKVLFMSGYSSHAALAGGVSQCPDQFIRKPFTPRDLTEKVRSVLDRR